jgi:hypothetical protein
LWEKHWSPELSKQIVWLSGVSASYEKAEETLVRIGGIGVSDSSVWRQAQKWGEKLQAIEEREMSLAEAGDSQRAKKPKAAATANCKGVGLDGTMIYIRQEGWKELKIGCVFDIQVRATKDKETGKWQPKAHATHNQYTAHLGGPEQIGQKTWALARRHGWLEADKTIALGDGAIWIWHQFDHRFVNSEQLVDWYHATDHLHTAASLLHAQQSAREAWYDRQKSQLFAGQAQQIAEELIVAAIDKPWSLVEEIVTEALYLDNNHQRMNYQALQAAGYPIGSGMVESGCKQFKARFDGPGMRWSRQGAQRLLPIRAAVMSHSFDSIWAKAHLPPN